jgi:hypothetical protein
LLSLALAGAARRLSLAVIEALVVEVLEDTELPLVFP